MAELSDLYQWVLPEVEGCPNPLADRVIRTACIRFCTGSTYWRETLTSEVMTAGISNYDLVPESGNSIIHGIVDPIIVGDGDEVYQRTQGWLEENYPQWRTKTGGRQRYFMVPVPAQVRFVPFPDADTTFEATIILKPKYNTNTIPDFILEEFAEEVGAGAVSILLQQLNKDWSNPQMGVLLDSKFEQDILTAHAKVAAGFKVEDHRNKSVGHFF